MKSQIKNKIKYKKIILFSLLLFRIISISAMELPHLQNKYNVIDHNGLFDLPNEMSDQIIDFLWSDIAFASTEQLFQTTLQAIARLKQVKKNFNAYIKVNYENNNGLKNKLSSALTQLNISTNLHDPIVLKTYSPFLIRTLCKINDVNEKDKDGNTPLMFSERLETTKALLKEKSNVNIQNKYGETALMYAIMCKQLEVIKELIHAGAQVDLQDKNGETVFMRVARHDLSEAIEHLVDKNSYRAYEPSRVIWYQLIIDKKNNSGNTPLIMAAMKGRLRTIKALLEHGAQIDRTNNYGDTALMLATDKEVIEELIKRGASIDLINKKRATALMIFAQAGYLDATDILLRNGAQINIVTNYGSSALHFAAAAGHIDIVKLLLNKGAIITIQTKSGRTPLHCATENGHIDVVKELIKQENYTQQYLETNSNIILKVLYHLCLTKNTIYMEDNCEQTLLMCAAKNGHIDVVKELIKIPYVISASGSQALMSAHKHNHTNIVELLKAHGASFPLLYAINIKISSYINNL